MSATGRERIDLLLARWVLGRLAPEEVPQVAVKALERGCESPTVAVLAGARDPSRVDIEDELPAFLRDVGRGRPSELEAVKTLVDDCAARIVEGDVEPVAGAAHIWSLWSEHVGDADREPVLWTDVRAFIGAASECENPGPHVLKYAADIVDEARALLGRGGLNIGGGIGDAIRLFEIARGDDVDLAVELPPSWAVEHDRVEVIFEDWDVCGWHAMLESPDGDRVLSFPWYDHVDKMLRGEVSSELPDPALPGGGWDDLEQGLVGIHPSRRRRRVHRRDRLRPPPRRARHAGCEPEPPGPR